MLRLILVSLFLAVSGMQLAAAPRASGADELMVVHCLLPGQVRQLGTRTTYVSARQPVRTTALECRVKGGEYVIQDKANLKSALKVWLKAAQDGDAEAQTTLGEVFEQGLGVPSDYTAASSWYEKAAAQGHARALTNLGNLFERGLGVAADPAFALQLYRQAAGLPAELPQSVVIDHAPDVAPVNALVREEVERLGSALQQMRAETARLKSALSDARESLKDAVAESEISAQAEQRANRALSEQRLRLEEYENLIAQRDAVIDGLLVDVQALGSTEAANTRLVRELNDLNAVINEQRVALDDNRARLAASGATAAELQAQIEMQQQELSRRADQAQAQVDQVQQLLGEIKRLRAEQQPPALPLSEQALLAGPRLALVDPILPTTRGLVKVSLPAAKPSAMQIIGRVTAPAGLLSLTVNHTSVATNPAGVFVHALREIGADGLVEITAVDQQGKRADLRFAIAAPQTSQTRALPPQPDLGNFHALLIGNTNYQYLPRLETPRNDIERLREVLSNRYGFSVTTVENATRYELLSALNDLRADLKSNDNLLIYYAGHGELDRKNMRGHWLPVDAEPDSTANWVSNVAITDILNVFQARQIMLVVDSCYSGTLTRSSLTNLDTAMTDAERATWLNLMASKKTRVVLTSGGLAPVMDAGGGEHSVFAAAFLNVLTSNAELLTGRSLYEAIVARVAHAASEYDFEQIPAYAPIARSGHEAGDFMLLPVRL